MLLFEQGITEMIAPVEFGGTVPDEFVFSGLQVAQCALALRRKRGGPKGQRGGHTRQHARIHRIGLGALSGGLGEAPRLPGIDLGHRQLGFEKGQLKVTMVGSGGFIGHTLDGLADPGDQFPKARCVVGELGGLLPGQLEGVQVSLGDIHSYGMISHLFFSCACNASLAAHVSIQDDEKRRWRPNSQTALKGQRGHGPTTATLGSSRAPRVAPFKHTSEGFQPSTLGKRASCPRRGRGRPRSQG